MEVFLKSYDREKYVFTKLILQNTGDLKFIAVESFKAHFVHPSYPLYLGSCSCEENVLIDNEKRNVVLYNPTSQRLLFLPPSTIAATPRSDTEKCRIDLNCTAFGKDYTTGEIKVLRQVVCNYSKKLDGYFIDCENKYELYSPRTGSWKRIATPADDHHGEGGGWMLSHWASVCVSGVFYWPAYFCKDGSWAIRTFDFATETFSTMPRAPKPPGNFSTMLVAFEGDVSSLGSFVFQDVGEPKEFQLWSWRNGPKWTFLKKYVIPKVDRPIGFVSGRFLFLEETLQQYPHRCILKVFDCHTEKLESLDIYDHAGYMQVVSYVNSSDSAALPNSTELSTCNKADVWDKYWEPMLALSEDEDEEEEEE